MKKSEVMMLMAEIQENYPNFDVSEENINRHFNYLQDISFEEAMNNVQRHIKTNDFPPKISQIRGHIGDSKYEESKKQAERYVEQLNSWSKAHEPPTEGYWNKLKMILRGDQI